MLRLTHIVNPVKVTEASDLYVAQPITFESIKKLYWKIYKISAIEN